LPVRIARALGAGIDDLAFTVAEGPAAGQISPSREPDFDPAKPTIMLLVGSVPGTFHLRVTLRRNGTLLTNQAFRVTTTLRRGAAGPSFWFTGAIQSYASAAWGGGPGGPQNIATVPAPPTWRLAVVMIDFSDQRLPSDPATLQGYRDDWYRKTYSGYYVNFLYGNFSVRDYYRNCSFNRFDLQITPSDIHGPVNLAGQWTNYFSQAGGGQWLPRDWQALVSEVQTVVDFHNYDTVVFASSHSPGQPQDVVPAYDRTGWPYATLGKAAVSISSGGTSQTLSVGLISISNGYVLPGDYGSLAHELGHNLRLTDQYYNVPAGRDAGPWDIMGAAVDLPQLTLPHKMLLGWVDPGQIEAFDFATSIAPVDQVVTLSPAEVPAPAGGKLAVEVRVADGLNYYFEYRVSQPAQANDKGLNRDNTVLGTDYASTPNLTQRPWLLTLAGAPTGIDSGEAYEETSASNITWPGTLRAEVSGITGTQADVRIRFGANGKPDPAIRPWPASPSRPWQSPDIEVRNVRNLADPASWFNVPWEAHTNEVLGRVTNRGTIDAPAVVVDFYVKDFTVTNAAETLLGTDQHDIPAGQTVEFQTTWTPPDQGHYCIVVRIRPYSITSVTPPLDELTALNNEAQSNYDRYISRTMSPAERVVTSLSVQNPYTAATRVYIYPGQSNPLYRTYLGNKWVDLNPGASRDVEIMFEYGPVGEGAQDREVFGAGDLAKHRSRPNDVSFAGMLRSPGAVDSLMPASGVQVQVVTGKSTQFAALKIVRDGVTGRVQTLRGRQAVRGGKVIVTARKARARAREASSVANVSRSGAFRATVSAPYDRLEVYFVPPPGFADCVGVLKRPARKVPPRKAMSSVRKARKRTRD
jgi:M6 family metalloprotease-like protein